MSLLFTDIIDFKVTRFYAIIIYKWPLARIRNAGRTLCEYSTIRTQPSCVYYSDQFW